MNEHRFWPRRARTGSHPLAGRVLVGLAGVGLALCLTFGAGVRAQDEGSGPSAESAADERATGFEAVEGASRENVSGLGLMVGAYGIVWAFTLLYLVHVGRLEARLSAEVARLDRALGPE